MKRPIPHNEQEAALIRAMQQTFYRLVMHVDYRPHPNIDEIETLAAVLYGDRWDSRRAWTLLEEWRPLYTEAAELRVAQTFIEQQKRIAEIAACIDCGYIIE